MSIQTISTLPETQSPSVLDRRMQGPALYLARGIYVVLLLVVLVLTIKGISAEAGKEVESRGMSVAIAAYSITLLPYFVGQGCVSVFLFIRRSNDWLVFLVALALLLSGALTWVSDDGARSMGLYRLVIFLNMASNVLKIFLAFTFPNGVFIPAWTRKFFWLPLLLAIVDFSLNSFWERVPLLQNPNGTDLVDYVWQLCWAVGICAQIYRFRYISNPIERQQFKWVLVALPIAFLLATTQMLFISFYSFDALDFSQVLTIIGVSLNILVALANLLVAVALGLAMYRYKLWEADFYLVRTLVFSAVTGLLAALWWFGAILVQLFLDNIMKQETSPMVLAILSGIPAATLFQPLRENTKKWINTRLYKDQIDFTKVIVELQPENWQFVGIHDMAQAVIKNTARLLEIDKAAIYVFDGDSMQLMNTNGITPEQASQFHEINISEQQKGKVIQLEKENLFTMLVPLVVPRGHTNDLIGVLALGPRAQDRGYSRDHISNLKNLGERAGVAIHFLQLNEKKKSS